LFFAGQLVSLAGSWMQTVALQWLVYDLTKSAAWLGIVSGASAIPYLLFALWGGHTADSFPRRTILIRTQAAAMFSAFALAVLATGWWTPIRAWHITVIAAVGGIINAFNMPAQQAFVTDMVQERGILGNAIALNSLIFNMARFLGPILAGAVLVRFGPAACFGLNGLSFLAVIGSLTLMRLPPFHPRADRPDPKEAFAFIRGNLKVFRTIALVGTASMFAWSATTLLPVFAGKFGRGPAGYTWLMTANGIGAATGGLLMAITHGRFARRTLIYGGAALFCLGLLAFSSAPSFLWACGLLTLSGVFMITFSINANTKVQEDVPDSLRGRAMAIYSMVFLGIMPLGGLEIGYLSDHFGPVAAVRLNAMLCLIIVGSLFGWSRREERSARSRLQMESAN
jgi:MFS family permease